MSIFRRAKRSGRSRPVTWRPPFPMTAGNNSGESGPTTYQDPTAPGTNQGVAGTPIGPGPVDPISGFGLSEGAPDTPPPPNPTSGSTPPPDKKKLLTQGKAVRRAKVSRRAFAKFVADGQIEAIEVPGRGPLFEKSEIKRFRQSAPYKKWKHRQTGAILGATLGATVLAAGGAFVYWHSHPLPPTPRLTTPVTTKCPAGYPYYDAQNNKCYSQPLTPTSVAPPHCPAGYPYYNAQDNKCYNQPVRPTSTPATVAMPPGYPQNLPDGTYDISYCNQVPYGNCQDGGSFPASGIAQAIGCPYDNGGGNNCTFQTTHAFDGSSFVGIATINSCDPNSPCGQGQTQWTVTKE